MLFGILYFSWLIQSPVSAEKPIEVFIEGKKIEFTVQPTIENGTTLVPFRPVFESVGLDIVWDGTKGVVTGKKKDLTLELQLDSKTASINGKLKLLEVAPRLVDGQTVVPLRFVVEAMGKEVRWDSDTRTIQISSNLPIKPKQVTYEGSFLNGLRNGFGKLYEDGNLVYEGEFALSLFEGKGKKYYPNGKLNYEGDFSKGFMHGHGKLYREDGTLWYVAQFTNETIQGQGTIYFPDGHRLDVGFENGLPTGDGTYYFGDGTVRYVGGYKNGLRNGEGTIYYGNGVIMYEGEFIQSKFIKGKSYYEDGKLHYEGEMHEFEPEGMGVEYNRDGTIYHQGQFHEGKPVLNN
jgi:internalin A